MNRNLLVALAVLMLTGSMAGLAGETPQGQPREDLDRIFRNLPGFLGGDGFYTVPLGNDHHLVLFGDSFLDPQGTRTRAGAPMVNNAAAFVEGDLTFPAGGVPPHIVFPTGSATAPLFPSAGPGRYFWPLDGIRVEGRLYLFTVEIEKVAEDVFGFREAGNRLWVIDDPDVPPERWQRRCLPIPHALLGKGGFLLWGGAVLRFGDEIYVYGVVRRGAGAKSLVMAKVPARIERFADWRFFSRRQGFSPRLPDLSVLLPEVPSEFSVAAHPDGDRFLLVGSGNGGMSEEIVAFQSRDPWFSAAEKTILYKCPEMRQGGKVFTYSAKAVKTERPQDRLVIVYFTNAPEFGLLFANPNLYWPTFITCPWPRFR